uniref:FBA_2 domain-containing protein n=1 Tax=Panagrellus redivivus TaxID=6233 RepID=A0A7E4UN60_PANRE
MAYPLSKFAYSFTERLQELAAPVELYHLQLADIDETVFKNDKIAVLHARRVSFDQNNVTAISKQWVTYDQGNHDILTTNFVSMRNCSLPDIFTHFIFKQLVFEPECITLYRSDIHENAIYRFQSCSRLNFRYCTIEKGVTAFSITKSLPLLKHVEFENSVADTEFFADLNDVFFLHNKRIYIFDDSNAYISKLNLKNIPYYFSTSIFKYCKLYRKDKPVEVSIETRNRFTEAQFISYILPLTYCLVGPTVSYEMCDDEILSVRISNKAQWHFWGLRWRLRGQKRNIFIVLGSAIFFYIYRLFN